MPAVRTIFIYKAFKSLTKKSKTLKGFQPETLQQAPQKALALLCKRYLKNPSWWGLFVLAFAQRTEVEGLYSLYSFMVSPSEVLEFLGQGVEKGNPARGCRDYLRTKWRGLSKQFDREGLVASLTGAPDLDEWLHRKTLLLKLTDDQLRLLNLYHLEEFTQDQIAELLDVTKRTVINRLNKIEALLKR